MNKCLTCPYKQGLIKSKIDPCMECKFQNRKNHPFSMPVEIRDGEVCAKCGGNRFVNGMCVACGAKQRRKMF